MTMIWRLTVCAALLSVLPLTGCDKRAHKSSGGSLLDTDQAAPMGTTNVYRFVGVEQSLADARKAVLEERWEEAIAASDALLREQPGNTEAQSIRNQARLELPNQQHYNDFMKAASANEVAVAVKNLRLIAEGSLYRDKARVTYEKLRQSFLDSQETEARALARAGRCDEARRAVRVASEWFPDSKGRMDDVAVGCRPARGEEVANKEKEKEKDKEKEREELAVALLPVPSAPVQVANEVAKPTPEPPRAAMAAPAPAQKTMVSAAAPPAPNPPLLGPPPAVAAPPRNVQATELEKLRVAGEISPQLPAGARMIAHRDGVKRVAAALKYCVSEAGVPTAVTLVKATDYNDANEKILGEVRRWRFRPYVMNGAPTAVCTATLLNYQIE